MVELTMDGKKLKAGIAGLKRSSKSLADKTHTLGIQAMLHAKEHQGVDYLNGIVNALNSAHRPDAFKAWVRTYTPLEWGTRTKGDKKISGFRFKKDWTEDMWRIEEANEHPYGEAKENDMAYLYGIENVDKGLKGIVSRIEKRLDAANNGLTQEEAAALRVRRDNIIAILPNVEPVAA